jgi:lipoprotein-anchoring transpeptidase ErfK/SrfK
LENDKNDIIDESNEVNESIKKRKPPLSKIIILSIFALFCIAMSYSFYAYNDIISDFKIDFDKKDYSAANSLIVSKGNFNPAKKLLLYSDLRNYFSTYIDDLISNYKNNNISDETTLSVLNEVDRYGVVSDKIRELKKKIPLLTDSANNFSLGIKLYKDKNYVDAYAAFDKVNNYDDNFLKAEEYKKEVANCIKQETLSSAEKLVSENYFSKAISLLEDNTKYYSNDKDVLSKIDEYKKDKDNFLNKDSSSKTSANDKDDSSSNTASSNAASTNSSKDTKKDSSKSTSKTENGNNKSSTDSGSKTTSVSAMVINSSTINSLNLNSDTPYLVYVNLSSQKTYVYKGKKNGWTLLKNFSCSTGIKGSDTPSGIFTVKEKGDWFYSDEYKEGAKYWVQFDGNYLFHSLPYNSSKSQITDFTLGKAASHGCVRLKLEDAKWIYDNVSRGSKVIIN